MAIVVTALVAFSAGGSQVGLAVGPLLPLLETVEVVSVLAVLLGVPVSFNEIVVSAIIGSGAAIGGGDAVSVHKIGVTVGAWAGSFGLAFALGYGATVVVQATSMI